MQQATCHVHACQCPHGPQNYGEEVTGEQLHEILKEIDTNMNGQVELDEYLQVYIVLTVPSVCFCCMAQFFYSC